MKSLITFLGTAGDEEVMHKQLRASAGIILNLNSIQLHIDPGPGILTRALQYSINLAETDIILSSSGHMLNSHDINLALSQLSHEQKKVLICGEDFLQHSFLLKRAERNIDKIHILKPGDKRSFKDIDIMAIPAKTGSIGYKILTPRFILTYTGETEFKEEIVKNYEDTNILIINCPSPFGTEKEFNADDVVKIIERIEPELIIITGFGIKMLAHDPIDVAREIQKKTNKTTVAAKDGLIINPSSYSITLKQKTLKGFFG